MCFPAIGAIAGLAMSAVSAGAQLSGQQQQYQQQVRQYQQNVTNSETADRDQQDSLALREEQEQQLAAQKMQQQSVQGAIAASRVSASAAGANVAGASVNNLINDIHNTVDENNGVLESNYRATAQQLQSQKVAGVDQDQSRIDGVSIPVAPNQANALLGVAGSGLKAFGQIDSRTPGNSFGSAFNLSSFGSM